MARQLLTIVVGLGGVMMTAGCPGPEMVTDTGVDAPSTVDAPSMADVPSTVDAPSVVDVPSTVDAPSTTDVPSSVDAPAGDEVARCEAASAALAAACPDDGARTCQAAAFGEYCADGGRPGLFADALDCLVENSSAASGCRTFSDPSAARECVLGVYADTSDPAVDGIITRVESLCAKVNVDPALSDPPLYTLTPAQLTSLADCLEGAADCLAASMCAMDIAAPIAACFTAG